VSTSAPPCPPVMIFYFATGPNQQGQVTIDETSMAGILSQ
jgi:hypothetical protein